MSTKLKAPDGVTSASCEGAEYEIGEDGLFDILSGEHVETLCRMGFLTESELVGVNDALLSRWPRVIHGLLHSGVCLATLTTSDGLLDLVESLCPPTPEEEAATEGTIVGEGLGADMLLGSSTLPTMIDTGGPEEVQLGTVVCQSQADSGLSVDEWNELSEEDRDALLVVTITYLRDTNAPQEGTGGAPPSTTLEADPVAADEATDHPDADPAEDFPRDENGNLTFNKLNRGQIHAWLEAHGGTELRANSTKDDLIAEAEGRADELIAAVAKSAE